MQLLFVKNNMKNQTLIKAARTILKELLLKLPEENQIFFKKIYSHKNLNYSIQEVVDNISTDKLDWAITQCENTIKNKNG